MHHHHGDSDLPPRGPRPTAAQVVALGLVAASIGWAAWLVRDRPGSEEVELLPGTVLPYDQLALVEAAFDRAQLSGHRTEEGRVWVPRPRQSAYLRALVDADALPRDFGSSLRRAVENNNPWQSRAAQEEMLRIAVQDDLQHVINSMPGIERAAVFYDVGERSGFHDGPTRTASVSVRTQPDVELEPARVQAIRVLVAASIAGLEAERVAVTDLRSGRVFSGQLDEAVEEPDAAVDADLARRMAHERRLAVKVRQALGFVKGAVVDVTVTFPAVEPAPVIAAVPVVVEPALPKLEQRVADANAPAEIGPPAPPPPVEEPAVIAREPARAVGPDTILVAVAIPDTYLRSAVQAALARDPSADPAEVENRERERLVAHVRTILPPTPRPDDCRVVMTEFPVVGARGSRPPLAAAPMHAPVSASPAGPSATPPKTPGEILDATSAALARRDLQAVPREAWLAVIAVAAGVLAILVLWTATDGQPRRGRPRRRGPRIDWDGLAAGRDEAARDDARKVAA